MNSELLVINFLLYYPEKIAEFLSNQITPKYFENNLNRLIYKVMITYFIRFNKPISIVELKKELDNHNIKPELYEDIFTMSKDNVVDLDVQWLISYFLDEYKKKTLNDFITKSVSNYNGGDTNQIEKDINKIYQILASINAKGTRISLINEDYSQILDSLNLPVTQKRFYLGYPELDSIIHGLKPQWLTVVAARPKTGKTRTMINFIANMIQQKHNVIAFTLEMPMQDYRNLLFSNLTSIPYWKFEEHQFNEDDKKKLLKLKYDFENKYGKLIIVDTMKSIKPSYIRSKIDEIEGSYGMNFDVIFIDHATMMRSDSVTDTDWLAQGSIAEDIRAIGREKNKLMITALQIRRHPNSKKKEEEPGDLLARSDIWYQTLDVLITLEESPKSADSMLETLDFKIISRYASKGKTTLIKQFEITKLLSQPES